MAALQNASAPRQSFQCLRQFMWKPLAWRSRPVGVPARKYWKCIAREGGRGNGREKDNDNGDSRVKAMRVFDAVSQDKRR